MNKKILLCLIPLAAACLSACTRPEVIEIKPNETAFLIQMDGNSKTQRAFMSEEYLVENKVRSEERRVGKECRL